MSRTLMSVTRPLPIKPTCRAMCGGTGARPARLRVVMDLDECMVHTLFDDDEYHLNKDRVRVDTEIAGIHTARLSFNDKVKFFMHLRPGVREYLQEVSSFADVYGYTAGMSTYAKQAFKYLDPDQKIFKKIWSRERCINYQYFYSKDLAKVLKTDFDEKRTLLVDNEILSFIPQPENGLLIEPFYGNPLDVELTSVLSTLHDLDKESDVRPALLNKYQVLQKLEAIFNAPNK